MLYSTTLLTHWLTDWPRGRRVAAEAIGWTCECYNAPWHVPRPAGDCRKRFVLMDLHKNSIKTGWVILIFILCIFDCSLLMISIFFEKGTHSKGFFPRHAFPVWFDDKAKHCINHHQIGIRCLGNNTIVECHNKLTLDVKRIKSFLCHAWMAFVYPRYTHCCSSFYDL